MTPPRRIRSNHRCLRCGYDLRGVMESWTNSCPLDGTCSECGLKWEWAELISPTRRLPRWNIELSSRPWSPRVFLRTLFMQLSPWIAWRELRMEHAVRGSRLVGYAGRIVLMCILLWYGAYVGFAAGNYVNMVMQRANGSVYSPAAEVIWLQFVFMPWSDQSVGSVTHPTGTFALTAPARMFQYWLEYEPFAYGERWSVEDRKWGIASPLVVIVCWMIALAGTPTWLRHERLRYAHYFRIAIYALSFIMLHRLATTMTFWVAATDLIQPPTGQTIIIAQTVAFAFMFLLGLPWWMHVCDDYLRLNQPRRVAVVVHVFGFVVPLGVIGLVNTIEVLRRGLG